MLSRVEIVAHIAAAAVALILSLLLAPAMITIALLLAIIWSVMAAANGYLWAAYGAVIIGLLALLLIYPFSAQQSPAEHQRQAQQLAAEQGFTIAVNPQQADNQRGEKVYIFRNQQQLLLVRQGNSAKYPLAVGPRQFDNQQLGFLAPLSSNDRSYQGAIDDFKQRYPLNYAPALVFFLLPVVFLAALPRRKNGKIASIDGRWSTWFLPPDRARESQSIVGQAGVQLIFLALLIAGLAFIF